MSVLQTGLAKSLAEDYTIDQSCRFNRADNDILSRTPASTSDRQKWTLSVWVKRAELGTGLQTIFGTQETGAAGGNGEQMGRMAWDADNEITYHSDNDSTFNLQSTPVYRDTGSWYHLVIACDTTQVTNTNRLKFYVNGDQITDFGTTNWPSQNLNTPFNYAHTHRVGASYSDTAETLDGYLAEFYWIDGTQLTPSSFAETDDTTNQWKPLDSDDVKDAVTFGTNGFYQKYALTELANSFTDSANHSIHTVVGVDDAHTDTSVKKFGTASLQLPHTGTSNGDYLYVAPSDDWVILTGDYTWDLWVYFDSVSGTRNIINQNDANFSFIYSGGNLTVTQASTDYTFSWTPSTGTWYHLAVTRSSGSLRVFVDGNQVGSTASATESISGTGGNKYLYIGDTPDQPTLTDQFEGYMDEIRFSNGIARWTGGFIPPTSAYTADVYTLLLLHCDGSDGGTTFTDSSTTSGGRHRIFPNGDVANTRAQKKVGESSIYFDGTGDYLSIPNSTDWDLNGTGDFTVEFWVRLNDVTDSDQGIFSRDNSGGSGWVIPWQTGGAGFQFQNPGNNVETGTAGFSNDTWYHIAICRDSGTLDIYKDGVSKESVANTTDLDITSTALVIGRFYADTDNYYLNGYLDEIRISNTARYTGDFTPQTTQFTSDANTLLLIHSDFDGGLGADSSGNANDFSVTNLVATDQMKDSPTNNFATWNPLAYDGGTAMTEGNLNAYGSSGTSANEGGTATIGVTSGKWYWENRIKAVGNACSVGIFPSSDQVRPIADLHQGDPSIFYKQDGNKQVDDSSSSYGNSFTTGDIIGVALNLDDDEIKFYKNNTVQNSGTAISVTATSEFYNPVQAGTNNSQVTANFGSDSSFAGDETAQGNADGNGVGDFYYEPPSGYLALCTDNLSDPEIKLPGDYFNTVLWSGDDANPRTVSGVGFQADMTWQRRRNGAADWRQYDSVRAGSYSPGTSNPILTSNNNSSEWSVTTTGTLSAWTADGFTLSGSSSTTDINNSAGTYASWNWLAGGTPTATNSAGAGATPTAGSVKIDGSNLGSALAGSNPAKKISASTTAGFSIVSYEGNIDPYGVQTIAHGLSEKPTLIIIKNLEDSQGWPVGATVFNASWEYVAWLEGNGAAYDTGSGMWNDTAPTASVWTVNDAQAAAWFEKDYIAYCWHSVEGYSKIGSYTGNGNADGTFIYTGFRPAWVMIKRVDTTGSWSIRDSVRAPYNVILPRLWADLSNAESTSSTEILDFTSNGIKTRANIGGINTSGGTYAYLAFAAYPFKYAPAR